MARREERSGEKLGQTRRSPARLGEIPTVGRIADGTANSAQHDARAGGNIALNLENMERNWSHGASVNLKKCY